MLGIWHGGDYLKRDLAQLIYGQVECGSPISIWFIAFIPLVYMCKSIDLYVDFMVDIIMVFMLLLCWLYDFFMTTTMYGSQHVFTCK